ncbi:sulfatase-like hydrolase/transferase [Streptomyces coeruleorubidus]|uniref:CDP-alcohol phosphatidyltransferase n=1 Tax=Streptomyces coeruleorubidus TaxID=116188 RepID=A0ABZ0KH39_STRC4|nr:sulfatase-like hydrolase/transferase [Streptomyces coeruleorubidus]WOT37055.1 CDP-alcohol phosphatidyltransferase [Streptomyces coeruleorubidus]
MPVFTRFSRPPQQGTPGAEAETERDAREEPEPVPAEAETPAPRARLAHLRTWRTRHPRAARSVHLTTTVLAAVLVLGALLLPNTLPAVEPDRFARIPAEAVIGAVVMLVLPRRPRLVAAVLYGLGLTALTTVNLLDMGFNEYLGRGFNAALDWDLLPDAQAYVEDTLGGGVATAAAVGAVVLVLLVAAVMVAATIRLADVLSRHRVRATKGALLAGTVWVTCAALGLTLFGGPIASERGAGALRVHAQRTVQSLRDEAAFAREAKADTFGNTPPGQLLPDLRGKDVIFTFIESYGRSAIEDPIMEPGVGRTLDTSTEALAEAGFQARSGWLTSATYGGSSWLGHSTTMSGLWIDNQRRYRTVTAGDHLTLTKAFQKTGAWDTVGVMPGVQKGWPEEKWYGLDKLYDAFDLGYRGPKFSWSTMPDQYALEEFQRRVHGKKRDKPLMSFVILTSSHQPWAPLPKMVGWDGLGDGSVFDAIQKAGNKASDVITDTTKSRQEYGKSIQYSVTSLTQWLERYGTDDTVLVFLGDHQPMARVSGNRASRDVPVSIVAKDPKVLDKVADWNWTEGLKPDRDAPVWKMSAFRDRFLKAYGSTPHASGG